MYAGKVARFAAMAAGHDAVAEDIAQDALLKAMRALDRYDPARGSLDAWLWRIVTNPARDATRRARLRALVTERLRPGDQSRTVEEIVVERVTVSEIVEAMTHLAPRDRELLALRFGADLETAEVAARVGLSADSARRAISRALARLRHVLAGGER